MNPTKPMHRHSTPAAIRQPSLFHAIQASSAQITIRLLSGLVHMLPTPLRRRLGQALRQGLRFGHRIGANHLSDHVGAMVGLLGTMTDYPSWARRNEALAPEDLAAIAAHVARMVNPPLISVVMPVYNTPDALLLAAVNSVVEQLYPHWELCIADDASSEPHIAPMLARLAASDPRIRVARRDSNGHISRATNTALALARGEFVALMDHDDLLHPRALYEVAAEVEGHPDADVLFTDEDQVDLLGRRSNPHFKPGWNPDLLLGYNYINHLTVYRRQLVEWIGRLRPEFDGSQDYDLLLRATAGTTTDRIRHIPQVLYHWRRGGTEASFSEAARERCLRAGQAALQAHLTRTGVSASVLQAPALPDWWRVRRIGFGTDGLEPRVSVIIPTRDRAHLLSTCLKGVLRQTNYSRLEVLVADNGSQEAETGRLYEQLRTDSRVQIIDCPGPFNYAAINNRAAQRAQGEVLLLLNNDIEVLDPEWLREMVSHAIRPEIGAVGARLLYPDGRIQHAGVALGMGEDGVAGHVFLGQSSESPGYFGYARLIRNVAAVTGACLAIRRDAFEAVGGFDAENLAVAFNDVDLCLRLRELGMRNTWTPFATLVHHESVSRGSDRHPSKQQRFAAEVAYMRRRWGSQLSCAPYENPNLVPGTYRLAPRPRRPSTWSVARAPTEQP